MGKIEITPFGTLSSGQQAALYTLANSSGMKLKVTDFGATIVSLLTPMGAKEPRDLVLGFDSVSGYEKTGLYLGATIGRYAGQIRDAKFTLNGNTYNLYVNDHTNTLHGGKQGFDKRLFTAVLKEEENKIEFHYFSKNGEEGFPGNLRVIFSYQLMQNDEILMEHIAQSDEDTILNMTNHSYYNLDGQGSGSIENHTLTIHAEDFLEVAEDCCPDGKILSVQGTPMDFTTPQKIGARIDQAYRQLEICEGYDHNWNIRGYGTGLRKCAELESASGDLRMVLYADHPGLQMYSGNYLDGSELGKRGVAYSFRGAVCLEPQFYPAAPCYAQFPSPILRKGEQYYHQIKLAFFKKT